MYELLDVVDYIDLLGKPFLLGARGPDDYDCWGICLEIAGRAGIKYPFEFTPSEPWNQDTKIRAGLDREFDEIEKPEPYCIVTFKIHPPFVDHCGIVLPDCKHFIHTMAGHSVAKQRLDHKILAKRLHGFYKLRKDANNQNQ